MNELELLIIGFAMGYFWAIYRAENIRISGVKVYSTINAKEFWTQLEKWARENPEKPTMEKLDEKEN
ncbi:hypothetical protein KI809_10615 [Geobacter pelophilus]|uniref:Phage protein n=1 Tax=Geoanaerobacter pelophilus TaxID=60036 RepID=A0AAW4L5C1_9BACT|nr:hypothetical protein [Geoanaerobacter pelophilus]MBT0664752.1 hypothetical protein [Geoanaerobacter pelophilus]